MSTSGISDSQLENVKIRFRVSKDWVSSNEIDPNTIALYRYENSWTKLPTSKLSDSALYYNYEATSPGFSIFAISGSKIKEQETQPPQQEQPKIQEQEKPEQKENISEEPEEEPSKFSGTDKLILSIVGAIVVMIIVMAFFVVPKATKTKAKKSKKLKKTYKEETKAEKKKKEKEKKKKEKQKKKPRCPKCGSTAIVKGYGNFYFCRKCGAVFKKLPTSK